MKKTKKEKWWTCISPYVILQQSGFFLSHLRCGRSTGPGQISELEPRAQVDCSELECLTFLSHSCWVDLLYLPPFPLPLTSFHPPCRCFLRKWQGWSSGCFCTLGWRWLRTECPWCICGHQRNSRQPSQNPNTGLPALPWGWGRTGRPLHDCEPRTQGCEGTLGPK